MISAEEILACKDLNELVELLRCDDEVIPGSSKGDNGVEVARRIEQVRHGHRTIRFVTGALGIREKVETFLPGDKTYQKYVLGKKKAV